MPDVTSVTANRAQTPDDVFEIMMNYTGLTEPALRQMHEQKDYQGDRLNELFLLSDFWIMLDTITNLMVAADQPLNEKDNYGDNPFDLAFMVVSLKLASCIKKLIIKDFKYKEAAHAKLTRELNAIMTRLDMNTIISSAVMMNHKVKERTPSTAI